jgi:hypothetical protein
MLPDILDLCSMIRNLDPVLFSRLLRWTLGAVFIATGIWYYQDGAWPAIAFGSAMFITGFFRPRRCVDDKCDIGSEQ